MDDKRVAEYFVVCGLADGPHQQLDGFSDDTILKPTYKQDPIVDLAVINKGQGETPPDRFRCVETTPTGFQADLNHGSIRYPEMYLCYRRGRDKPPITDIGVLYDGKEKISPGCDAIYQTPYGRPANVNNSSNNHIYITYRRAMENAPCDTLSVMDICVILANKGETPPHAFMAVDKTLNKSMMGSTVYICYKKSMAKTNFLAYKPGILDRYPAEDHPDFPLAHNVPMFCLPLGATIEAWPAQAQHPMPKFSTFVLTQETGGKVYGAAVSFYEDYDLDQLTESEKEQLGLNTSPARRVKQGSMSVHQSKCICLLSKWPFFNTYKTFLYYLYRISISGPHPVPIERYVTHFMDEVPFPTPQRPRIQVELNFNTISLFLPEESPLPQSGASYITLLKHLGAESCMNVLLYTLMEHKILIHSLCPSVLTSAAEAIAHMIFPFHWHCPYIPLCPLALSEYLCAPTPFIVGVDSRYFDLFDPPPDVTCIDLDTNSISVAEDKKGHSSSYKMMPKKLVKQLRSALERLYELCCLDSYEGDVAVDNSFETFPVDQDLIRRRKQLEMESAIQEAFLRFMASLLKGYNKHLLPITQQPNQMTTDFSARFDVQGFIKSRDKAYQKFYHQLKDTQNFTGFIQERSFVSDKDASLAFFDECIEKIEEGKEDVKLIELEDASKSERTVVITPPEPEPNGKIFNYTRFPKLDQSLLPQKPKPAQLNINKHAALCPNSPMTKRTKQEVRTAQKTAKRFAAAPEMWAKCLLWHCYSLWFVHLPSYIKAHRSKAKALRNAYDVLCRLQGAKLHAPDEVCYRVLMQLCGQYHQPIMAVRVFSEMRRHGINPNAITYGFYNKAVLESKWPSSDTAYLRWNKVRNVILVIAQFKWNLRIRRRQSMCSMLSESDCDRISRGSFDSYLDEASTDKPDAGKPAETLNGLALVDAHSGMEEKTSTGEMSDRGYSSMTLDDAKRISIVIGSQDSIDATDKTKPKPKSAADKVANGQVSTGSKNAQLSGKDKMASNNKDDIAQRMKNGSGINGQYLVSLVPSPETETHDGAGNGRLSESPVCVVSDAAADDSVVVNSGNGDLMASELAVQGTSPRCDVDKVPGSGDWQDYKRVDGGKVSKPLDPFSPVQESLPSPLITNSGHMPGCVHQNSIQESSNSSGASNRTLKCDEEQSPANHSMPGRVTRPNGDDSLLLEDPLVSFETSTTLSDSSITNKSLTSPVHSIRTPVTENDPLGLFLPQHLSTVASAPVIANKVQDRLSEGLMAESDNGGLFASQATSQVLSRDMLIDLQPFSNTSTPVKSLGTDKHGAQTTISSSSASSPGSPLESWSPLTNQADGQPSLAGIGEIGQRTPTRKRSTLPRAGPENGQLADLGKDVEEYTHQLQSKTPSRSESFSSAFRHVTSRMATRFTEFKQSMATPTKGMGSSGSLHRPDIDRLITEVDESQMRKAGSLDHLGHGEPHGFPSHLMSPASRASLEDVRAPPGSRSKLGMPTLFNKASHLFALGSFIPPSSSLQGWATKIGTMKETLKTSLKESFSLDEADSDEEDYYRKSPDTQSSSSAATKEDNGSLQDCDVDKGSTIQSIFEPRDQVDAERVSLHQGLGSLQNIPQTLFNVAMEVDLCSLSRCQTCKSLLYDEEIMAGWTPDDSNLNTSCPFCGYQFVPSLQVFVKDYRHCNKPSVLSPSHSVESVHSIQSNTQSKNVIGNFPQANGAHRSMTSLSSADNILSCNMENKSADLRSVHSADLLIEMPNVSGDGFMSESSPNVNMGKVQDHGTSFSKSEPSFCLTQTLAVNDTPHEVLPSSGNLIQLSPPTTPLKLPPEPVAVVELTTELTSLSLAADTKTVTPLTTTSEAVVSEEACGEAQNSDHGDINNADKIQEEFEELHNAARDNLPSEDGHSASDSCTASRESGGILSGAADNRMSNGFCRFCAAADPISVPYLSPLVLRKELENVIEQEGDICLNTADFVDQHPIIYWNLLWYFKRLEVTSHIPGFVLTARSTNRQTPPKCWSGADSRHISVRALWDNVHMHDEAIQPLYILWKKALQHPNVVREQSSVTKSLLPQILRHIQESDLLTPIQLIMQERDKMRMSGNTRFMSIYRDLLFLSLVTCSRDAIVNIDMFDRWYHAAYQSLTQKEVSRTHVCDSPPTSKTSCCRKTFSMLEI